MEDAADRLNLALEGRYEILQEVGHGGMAVVFLAEDLKHARKVALKVLRTELAAVLGADRFLGEIEVTANLQHPNILPLFDSGEADGFLYYVMPYVEGESLRERLDREGPLPVEEAVGIARSVATALDYAHRHGVIHRDIKPSNILLHEGQALVVDFGVALAMRKAGGEVRLTETGLSVGTPHYMSPEQAAGDRELDARSDLYALGAVTYEMLVGEPPHTGRTPQAVVAKILTDTPAPIRRTRDLIPENVEAAVTKALARTPVDRFASAADFGAALADPAFRLPPLQGEPARTAGGAQAVIWRWLGPAAILLAVTMGALAVRGWTRDGEEPSVARYNLAFLPGQELRSVNPPAFDVAPGAEAIVYVGAGSESTQLWVKERGRLEARVLPGTVGASLPSVSPDGREVAFLVGAELRKVPMSGGPSVTLADSAAPFPTTWLEDGTLVYSTLESFRLQHVSGSGRDLGEIWPEQPGDRFASPTGALPDARGLLFGLSDASLTDLGLWVMDLQSGQAHRVIEDTGRGWYLDRGYLVFLRREGAVFGVPFDLGSLEVTGDPVPLLEGVRMVTIYSEIRVRSDGTLLMRTETAEVPNGEMVWVSLDGKIEAVDPGWRFAIPQNPGWEISPDGRQLAIGLGTSLEGDIWIKELGTGRLLRLTHGPADSRPGWSADGQFVFFSSMPSFGDVNLVARRADGTGEIRTLVDSDAQLWQTDLSPDGTWAVARINNASLSASSMDIVGYRLDQDTTEVPLLTSDYDETTPQLSPDGRWMAYVSMESGQREVYVRPFPDVDSGLQNVSGGRGGYAPRWGRDGRELYYISLQREMMAVQVEGGEALRVDDPRVLFSIPPDLRVPTLSIPYDVTSDGQRFIMLRTVESDEAPPTPAMVLIENWQQEVEERIRDSGQ